MPHLRVVAEHDLIRRGLKFAHLRLISSLRETGRIGAAAETLGMTQPGASRLLSELEALTGAKLYERHARGVRLTAAGQILADRARLLLADLDDTASVIAEAEAGLRGTARIGAVTGAALDLMLPVVDHARTAFPEIDICVDVETSQTLSEMLNAEILDFYIGRIPDGADARRYRFRPIGIEPISLVVRLDHPLVGRNDVTLRDCLDYDWVTQPPGGLLRRTTEDYLMSLGLPMPQRVLATTSVLFTLSIVNDTDSIAPQATSVANFFIERGALGSRLAKLPVAPDLAVKTFGLVQRLDPDLGPAARHIADLMEQALPDPSPVPLV